MLNHKPRKELGQHFLIDDLIIAEIIKIINPKNDQTLIEIGPGLGAITSDLLNKCGKLILIEIDRQLADKLLSKFSKQITENKLYLLNQDVLKVDLLKLPLQNLQKFRVVGNLPYNISSPLLFKLFAYNSYIKDLHFLLQKEFADRLVAKTNTKKYGRLTVMAQYHAHIEIVLNVPADAFKPAPKIESSMVKIVPHDKLPIIANNYEHFAEIVNVAFSQRRKVLSNCLKKYFSLEQLKSLNLDPKLRPEQLSVADFVKISNYLN